MYTTSNNDHDARNRSKYLQAQNENYLQPRNRHYIICFGKSNDKNIIFARIINRGRSATVVKIRPRSITKWLLLIENFNPIPVW